MEINDLYDMQVYAAGLELGLEKLHHENAARMFIM